jgi:hypothetical protein
MTNDQSHPVNRRNLLRWLGAAALIAPAALSACAHSTPPRQVKRSRSHITAKDRKNGGNGCWNLCDSDGRYR